MRCQGMQAGDDAVLTGDCYCCTGQVLGGASAPRQWLVDFVKPRPQPPPLRHCVWVQQCQHCVWRALLRRVVLTASRADNTHASAPCAVSINLRRTSWPAGEPGRAHRTSGCRLPCALRLVQLFSLSCSSSAWRDGRDPASSCAALLETPSPPPLATSSRGSPRCALTASGSLFVTLWCIQRAGR
jgi:hypothetical protein